MDAKSLKTSRWQRIGIILIAILLLGGTVFTYLFIFMGSSSSTASDNEELIADLTAQYDAKAAEIEAAAEPLSDQHFDDFSTYLSEVNLCKIDGYIFVSLSLWLIHVRPQHR